MVTLTSAVVKNFDLFGIRRFQYRCYYYTGFDPPEPSFFRGIFNASTYLSKLRRRHPYIYSVAL
jgi:hypothetical protein